MYLRVSTKPLPNDAKNSLPVDVRRSKTLLLKLPIMNSSDVIVRYGWRYFPFLSINNCSDSPPFLLSINSLQMQVRIASFE